MAEQSKKIAIKEARQQGVEPHLRRLAELDTMLCNCPKLLRDPALQLEKLQILFDLGLISFSPP